MSTSTSDEYEALASAPASNPGHQHAEQNLLYPHRNKRRYLSASARASQACQACAVSKVKCDNYRVCRRCNKKEIECIRSLPNRVHLPVSDSLPNELQSLQSQSQSQSQSIGEAPFSIGLGPAEGLAETTRVHQSTMEQSAAFETRVWDFSAELDMVQGTADSNVPNYFHSLPLASPSVSTLLQANDLLEIWNSINPPNDESRSSGSFLDPDFEAPGPEGHKSGPATKPLLPDNGSISISKVTSEVNRPFTLSLRPWIPDATDYLLAEEMNLLVHPDASLSADDSLGLCDDTILTKQLSEYTRDQILLMARNLSRERTDGAASPKGCFPSLNILDKFLKVFLGMHKARSFPFLHIPTVNLSSGDVTLVAACVAAGAVRSPNPKARKFGLALMEVVRLQIYRECNRTMLRIAQLVNLQAFFLQIDAGLWSGDVRRRDMAGSFVGLLVNMVRQVRRFRKETYEDMEAPLLGDTITVLDTKWRKWAEEESFKRLVYSLFIHCAQEAALKRITSALPFTEICAPIPATRELWNASNAVEWRDLYLLQIEKEAATGLEKVITLHDCLQRPSIFQEFPSGQDRNLAFSVVLYSTMNMIHDDYTRRAALEGTLGVEVGLPSGSGTVMNQDRHILRLMDETRSMWDIGAVQQTNTAAILLELTAMRASTPLDKMEMLLRNSDQKTSFQHFGTLQEWRGSRAGRKAVWHAGQVIRFIRLLDDLQPEDFLVVAAYQAALCLWIYRGLCEAGTLRTVSPSLDYSMPPAQVLHSDPDPAHDSRWVQVDGFESLESQRWVNLDGAIPVISIGIAKKLSENDTESDGSPPSSTVPLCADPGTTHRFTLGMVDLVKTKFTGRGIQIQISEIVCEVFRAFGGID